jgi:hypothetical protein
LGSGFHLRDIINAVKIGAALASRECGPDLLPHPPTPQEVGANIIQSELWPSLGAFQFPPNSLGCSPKADIVQHDRQTMAGKSGDAPSGCGLLDQSLQRRAHRVFEVSISEAVTAELQLSDEARKEDAALLY